MALYIKKIQHNECLKQNRVCKQHDKATMMSIVTPKERGIPKISTHTSVELKRLGPYFRKGWLN
jgi:hypothetical protein